MKPHVTPASIYLPSPSGENNATGYHVILIPGNPGLATYYTAFLTLLHARLNADISTPRFAVFAASLPNFADDLGATLSLRQVIEHVEQNIVQYVSSYDSRRGQLANVPAKVVLAGHSVGAYIALEVVRRWQERLKEANHAYKQVEIVGYVGLWPTIAQIADSSNGRIASVLLNLPGYLPIASALAKLFVTALPSFILLYLIHLVTGFPEDAAQTTHDFLKSRRGLYQALYMARDEMNEIKTDGWSDDIWKAGGVKEGSPKMAFHFGQKDHWVADETRDQLIAARALKAEGDGGPLMEIDQQEIPHAFCIRHSKASAEIAARLIKHTVSR